MRCILITVCTLLLSLPLAGRERESKLDLDVLFQTRFDNREYQALTSKTIFGSRLSPVLSASISEGKYNHKISGSIGVLRDFGASSYEIEPAAWYTLDSQLDDKTLFTLNCGVFPRALDNVAWPTCFRSDENYWYDNEIEGLMMSISRPNTYAVLGIDWLGQFGSTVSMREQFEIFSAARHSFNKTLSAGYYLSGVHYANSLEVRGVVDNVNVEPWIDAQWQSVLGRKSSISAHFGLIVGYQRDRIRDNQENNYAGRTNIPVCGDLGFILQKFSLYLKSNFYYGENIMPYYRRFDMIGVQYGARLYAGDPFFAYNRAAAYERLELGWAPKLSKIMDFKLAYVTHYDGEGFLGSQVVFQLNVNI